MSNNNVKKWELELFGMIDRKCERDHQIMEIMEHIDENEYDYHLKEMKEEDIKKEAIATYERVCQAWNCFTEK